MFSMNLFFLFLSYNLCVFKGLKMLIGVQTEFIDIVRNDFCKIYFIFLLLKFNIFRNTLYIFNFYDCDTVTQFFYSTYEQK